MHQNVAPQPRLCQSPDFSSVMRVAWRKLSGFDAGESRLPGRSSARYRGRPRDPSGIGRRVLQRPCPKPPPPPDRETTQRRYSINTAGENSCGLQADGVEDRSPARCVEELASEKRKQVGKLSEVPPARWVEVCAGGAN